MSFKLRWIPSEHAQFLNEIVELNDVNHKLNVGS